MARGPLTLKTKQQRALKAAAEVLGVSVEELPVPIIVETEQSKIAEAHAVTTFIETQGKDFKYKTCEICKKKFTYKWHTDGIKCCSVRCMATKLENMGLQWDPNRDPKRRWGLVVPLIVPAFALENIQSLLDEILKA